MYRMFVASDIRRLHCVPDRKLLSFLAAKISLRYAMIKKVSTWNFVNYVLYLFTYNQRENDVGTWPLKTESTFFNIKLYILQVLITSNDSRIRLYDLKDNSLYCKYKGCANTSSQIKAGFRYHISSLHYRIICKISTLKRRRFFNVTR